MSQKRSSTDLPFQGYVREVRLNWDRVVRKDVYPFSLPAIRGLERLALNSAVTFVIGENGCGKSTLIEAIAVAWGFNAEGGSRNFQFGTRPSHSSLSDCLTLVKGVDRPTDGYFLRAESFFNVASEVERLGVTGYGSLSLHEQSHGESFMALLTNRFWGKGLYVLDEPEAALSPTRQMAMLSRMHQLVAQQSQFIIATHSPILMAYPGALILELSADGIKPVSYTETEHYIVTKEFLNNPDRMLSILLGEQYDPKKHEI
jgi:predicted ATPase